MAQAIWADEFARSVPDIEEDDDDELWHVRMSSDDVKVLSLTRLDDLFRLSLVDAETLVWQPGMKSWVPLGVVAGVEDEPPPTTVPRHPAPPSPPRPVVQPLDPFGLVSAAKPLPVAPKLLAPVAISYHVPESVRPITISEVYSIERGGGFGRFLIGLALIAGLSVTLYRNDVVRNLAKSAQLESVYGKLEQALGGPSFGTPRALDRFSSAAAAAFAVSETPGAAPLAAAIELPKASPVAPAETPKATQAPSDNAPAVVSLDSLPLEKAAAPAEKAPAASEKSTAPVTKAATRVERAAEPVKAEKPRTLKDAIRASVTPNATFKPAKRKRGSEFDPLNPNL